MDISTNNLKYFFFVIVFTYILISVVYPIHKVDAYKGITPRRVKEMIDANSPAILILDVRTAIEYDENHIKTSVNIPIDELKKSISKKNIDKNILIVVYCESGIRSKKASETLGSLGFKNVFDLGGLNNWPYELEKSMNLT